MSSAISTGMRGQNIEKTPKDAVSKIAEYDYIAYIDEAGDPGLNKVRPLDVNGSSEWLIVSAAIVKREHECDLDRWISGMRERFVNFKAKDIHFARLNNTNKEIACSFVARRPVTIFTVCSNKKNIKGYDNPLAALRSLDNNWYYCWMTRVLLERVTYFIKNHSSRHNAQPKKVKLVFSTRGGLSYSQMKAYFELLKLQGRVGGLLLSDGQVYFEVIRQDLVEIMPHWVSPGLKLADIAASAFFRACDIYHTNDLNPRYAELLKPRVGSTEYRSQGEYEEYTTYAGYGVKILPSFKGAKLLPAQQSIFKNYGYPRQWWDPTPPTPSPYRLATIANRDTGRPE